MKKQMQNGNFYLGVAFIVMAILFYSSAQTYQEQSQISNLQHLLKNEPFLESFSKINFMYGGSEVSIASQGYFSFVEFFIRKAAHFTTYFIMGGSLFLGVYPRLNTLWLTGVLSWLAATGYAGLDEFHQMVTGGRSPMFQDVMLDSVGALVAVSICILIFVIKKKR